MEPLVTDTNVTSMGSKPQNESEEDMHLFSLILHKPIPLSKHHPRAFSHSS